MAKKINIDESRLFEILARWHDTWELTNTCKDPLIVPKYVPNYIKELVYILVEANGSNIEYNYVTGLWTSPAKHFYHPDEYLSPEEVEVVNQKTLA